MQVNPSEAIILLNEHCKATINLKGAEVTSVINNAGVEFMWQANPQIWPRTAPVLFPIVGKLRNNTYNINGNTHQLNQHGSEQRGAWCQY